jgi:hypothetical protein
MRDIVYIMRSWHREPAGVIEHFIFSLPRHISLHRFSFESFRMMTVIFEGTDIVSHKLLKHFWKELHEQFEAFQR